LIRQPIAWKYWGAEQKLILGKGTHANIPGSSVKTIQEAVLKALTWNGELLARDVKSIRDLELREKSGASYVRRILRLAYLSPLVLHGIGSGILPDNLHLETLRETVPLDWNMQAHWFKIA
jgi:hypothetical protein